MIREPMDAADLARRWQGACGCVHAAGNDFAQAVRLAVELAGKDGAVVGFGSLFLAANLRPFLQKAKNLGVSGQIEICSPATVCDKIIRANPLSYKER